MPTILKNIYHFYVLIIVVVFEHTLVSKRDVVPALMSCTVWQYVHREYTQDIL